MKIKTGLYLLFALSFFACSDPCADHWCGDYGVCDDGECLCDDAYEQGEQGLCNVEKREKFLGTWFVTENCGTAADDYTIRVEPSPDPNQLYIFNLLGGSEPAVARVTSSATFTIPIQNISGAFYHLTGATTGRVIGNTVSLSYTLRDNWGDTYNCSADWTK